jgi:hypothetical protein
MLGTHLPIGTDDKSLKAFGPLGLLDQVGTSLAESDMVGLAVDAESHGPDAVCSR